MYCIYIIKFKSFKFSNKVWFWKIGESNTTNLWRHLTKHHPDKDPKSAKSDTQSTLDEFMESTEFSFRVCKIHKFKLGFAINLLIFLNFKFFSLHKQIFISLLRDG